MPATQPPLRHLAKRRMHGSDRLVIPALLSGETLDRTARNFGISVATLRRWRRLPAFRAALEEALRENHELTLMRLAELAACSLTILAELMRPDVPPVVRLKAASTVLSHAIAAMDRLGQPEPLMPLDALVMGNNGHVLDVADNLVGHD